MRAPRRIGIGIAAAAVLLSAGCAAGQVAETANEKATLDGVNVTQGNLRLVALAVKPPSSTSYAPGSAPAVRLVLVNTGRRADQLTSISSSVATGWGSFTDPAEAAAAANPNPVGPKPKGATAPVTVKPGARVSWGTPEPSKTLLLLNIKRRLFPGTTITMTFTFKNAGSVTTEVPIQLSSGHPLSYVPKPEPSPADVGA